MIKDNQRLFNKLHVVLDAIVIAASYAMAIVIRFMTPLGNPDIYHLPYDVYFTPTPFLVVGYVALYYAFSLYSSKRSSSRRIEFYNIIKANILGLIAFMVVLYVINQPNFSRSMIFIFFILNIVLCTLERNIIRYVLRYFRNKGYNRKFVLLVGYSQSAESYIDRVIRNPHWGYVIRGILDDNIEAGTEYRGVKVLGRIGNLDYILPENKLDEIAITLSLAEYAQ